MVFTANHMSNVHGDVINNIDKMKNGFAIFAKNNKVLLFLSLNTPTDKVINDLRCCFDFFNRTFFEGIIGRIVFSKKFEINSPILVISTTRVT